MADGDVLTVDSAQTGGSGQIAGQAKFHFAAPAVQAQVVAPWGAFAPRGIYIPSGVLRDGAQNDDPSYAECELTAVTAQFATHVFAYPEVAPFAGTIDRLAHYFSGGGTLKFWIGLARQTFDANGNSYPGTIAAIFSYTHATGNDGQKLREGVVSVAVTKGERFWVLFQTDGLSGNDGYRRSGCYRNIFGNNTPATFSTTNQRPFIGWTTAAAVAYNAALASFPAGGVMMAGGTQLLGAPGVNGGNTINRPSVYHRYAV